MFLDTLGLGLCWLDFVDSVLMQQELTCLTRLLTLCNALQIFEKITFLKQSQVIWKIGAQFFLIFMRGQRPGSLKIVVKRLSAQCDESHRNIEHLNPKISVNSKTITQSISDCEFLTNIQILKQLKILLKIYYVMPFGWTKNSTIHNSQILLHRKRSLGLLVSPSRK